MNDYQTVSATPGGLAWFALFVRTRRERAVESALVEKGYDTYLPLMLERRHYNNKRRMVEVPCFPGYLFCKLDPADRLPLVMTPDLYGIVRCGHALESIPEAEIGALKVMTASGFSLERYSHLAAGDLVFITRGPLAGIQGVLLRSGNRQRIAVSIVLLHRSVSAEVNFDDIVPASSQTAGFGLGFSPINAADESGLISPP